MLHDWARQVTHACRKDTSLHHSHDAQLQGWHAQQAGIDGGHRRFLNDLTGVNAAAPTADPGGDFNHRRHLNLITEQETVVAADGSTYDLFVAPDGSSNVFVQTTPGSVATGSEHRVAGR